MAPKVRIVTLNFDGGEMTLDCLESLLAQDYPPEQLEIIMVDNASIDGIADKVKTTMPRVHVIEALDNLGFSGGCNLGIEATGDWDYVGLLNNDATVGPEWIRTMLSGFDHSAHTEHHGEASHGVGAVSPKMLFTNQFRGVAIDSPVRTVVGKYRTRTYGVRVSGVRLDGKQLYDHEIAFNRGFSQPIADRPEHEPFARYTTGPSELHIQARPNDNLPKRLEVRVSADEPLDATLTTPKGSQTVQLTSDPQWITVDREMCPYDVIQNAGSGLFKNGFGGDRGFHARDTGQFDETQEVFAWCGGAVLMSKAYIDDVGVFDEALFLYYEDTDMAWRGRLKGWKHIYEPRALVRHRHAASTVEGSSLFRFQVDRNRILTLVKNASRSLFRDALKHEAGQTAGSLLFDVIYPLQRKNRPRLNGLKYRLSVWKGALRHAPAAIRARRINSEHTRRTVSAQWLGKDV
jgi:GT2 family glycosyltransferase